MQYFPAIKGKKVCNSMNACQMHYAKLQKPDSKVHVLYDTHITFWKRLNYRQRKQIRGCQVLMTIEEA